jgi:hypothetical protein
MRLRIRTLLLTVALLSTITSTASASCLLDPFHWLFGCGCGPCYSNCGYGPPQGHAAGYGGYQPAYPGVMSPCAPCAPLCPILSIFRMPRCLPVPAIFQQCLDPCGIQCAAPMMQPAMIPYQPTMMPMQSMNMLCDEGWDNSGGMMPQMNNPMMEMQGMASDGDCCGDDGMMAGYQPGMMPSWSPQSGYPGVGVPTRSYNASLPPTGFGMFPRPRFIRRDARRYARRYAHQYRRMNFYPGYAPMDYPAANVMPYGYQQPMMAPQSLYSQPMYPQSSYQQPMYQQSSCSQPGCSQTGSAQAWSAPEHSAQYYPSQSYSTMPTSMMPPEMMHQGMMPVQQGWNPQTSWTSQPAGPQMPAQLMPPQMRPAQVMMSRNPTMSGDIMGDHEVPMSTAAAVPVVPNSFNGASPFLRASMSRPVLSTYNQYSKSVR